MQLSNHLSWHKLAAGFAALLGVILSVIAINLPQPYSPTEIDSTISPIHIVSSSTRRTGTPSTTSHPLPTVTLTASPTATSQPPTATASSLPATTNPPSTSNYWRPSIGKSFQWQFSGLPIETSVQADVFAVDLFETPTSVINDLHIRNRKVLCYINAGAWESYHNDQATFPDVVLGNVYEGYPNERWLDIRRIDLLEPIMTKRFDLCKNKGFDSVEPDNLDGYQQNTGFPLTAEHQLTYNRWLADLAHARGLSIGLKNDSDQASSLVSVFDWAVVESCSVYDECDRFKVFSNAGKAVAMIEYTDEDVSMAEICATASRNRFFAMLKDRELTAYRQTCPGS